MSEKEITKGNNHTSSEIPGKTRSANGTALELRDSNGTSLTVSRGQDDLSLINTEVEVEPDPTDILAHTLLELTRDNISDFDELHAAAMAMYRHYSETAINGAEVDTGGLLTADEMALKWLEEARKIVDDRKRYMETLLKETNKSKLEREKIKAKANEGPKKVVTNNKQINVVSLGENQRDRIMKLNELTNGIAGKKGLPELQVVDRPGYKGVLPGDSGEFNADTKQSSEAEVQEPKETSDEHEGEWLHGDDGGE